MPMPTLGLASLPRPSNAPSLHHPKAAECPSAASTARQSQQEVTMGSLDGGSSLQSPGLETQRNHSWAFESISPQQTVRKACAPTVQGAPVREELFSNISKMPSAPEKVQVSDKKLGILERDDLRGGIELEDYLSLLAEKHLATEGQVAVLMAELEEMRREARGRRPHSPRPGDPQQEAPAAHERSPRCRSVSEAQEHQRALAARKEHAASTAQSAADRLFAMHRVDCTACIFSAWRLEVHRLTRARADADSHREALLSSSSNAMLAELLAREEPQRNRSDALRQQALRDSLLAERADACRQRSLWCCWSSWQSVAWRSLRRRSSRFGSQAVSLGARLDHHADVHCFLLPAWMAWLGRRSRNSAVVLATKVLPWVRATCDDELSILRAWHSWLAHRSDRPGARSAEKSRQSRCAKTSDALKSRLLYQVVSSWRASTVAELEERRRRRQRTPPRAALKRRPLDNSEASVVLCWSAWRRFLDRRAGKTAASAELRGCAPLPAASPASCRRESLMQARRLVQLQMSSAQSGGALQAEVDEAGCELLLRLRRYEAAVG